MLSRVIRFSPLALILVSLLACANMSGVMGTVVPITHIQVQMAIKNNELDLIRKVCTGEWKVTEFNDKNAACDHMRKADASAAVSGPCETLVDGYAKAPKDSQKSVTEFAKAMAKCGLYRDIFEKVAHWGNNNEGARVLADVEAAGYPLEQEFVKYAKANPGPKFMAIDSPEFGMDHIGRWLVTKGSMQHCGLMVSTSKGASEKVRVWMLPYFREAKCKEGIPIAHELLLSSTPKYRMWACGALGEIGDATSLKKVTTLGQSDAYNEVQEQQGNDGRVWGVKVYPVQDACKEAAGKIKLRLD